MSIKDNLEKAANKKQMHEAIADMFERNTPVAKKSFDISEHNFSCSNFKACKPSWVGDDLQVEIVDSDFTHYDAVINKQDAIAIAKALGVTGEDLL
ncbi:MAG: hypothetical protein CL623_02105 [Arcobacter sp.]|nr:hypothetical protein [Arcobacter sp.]|tara:strand:+ start:21092 stop:21379 length:288 start_codon:yes stop_codon:yes gene_type:complete